MKKAATKARSSSRIGAEVDAFISSGPVGKLAKLGIITMSDLDRWIANHPRTIERGPYAGQREFMSRYQALKQLVGENVAIEMLNNLAVEQCTAPPRKRR